MSKPITLTLPWAVLVRDNERHGIMRGRIVSTAKYRYALQQATMLAKLQCRTKLEGPVTIVVMMYEPNGRRRDLLNYSKLLHDALCGAAYDDDSQIHVAHWKKAGIDKQNPRCEITIAQGTMIDVLAYPYVRDSKPITPKE